MLSVDELLNMAEVAEATLTTPYNDPVATGKSSGNTPLVEPATTAPSTVKLPSIFCVTAPVFTTKLDVSTLLPPPPNVS